MLIGQASSALVFLDAEVLEDLCRRVQRMALIEGEGHTRDRGRFEDIHAQVAEFGALVCASRGNLESLKRAERTESSGVRSFNFFERLGLYEDQVYPSSQRDTLLPGERR